MYSYYVNNKHRQNSQWEQTKDDSHCMPTPSLRLNVLVMPIHFTSDFLSNEYKEFVKISLRKCYRNHIGLPPVYLSRFASKMYCIARINAWTEHNLLHYCNVKNRLTAIVRNAAHPIFMSTLVKIRIIVRKCGLV